MADTKEPDNVWRIRNVDDATRKKVKLYAVEHGMGVAEALKDLVDIALSKGMNLPPGEHMINGIRTVVNPNTTIS